MLLEICKFDFQASFDSVNCRLNPKLLRRSAFGHICEWAHLWVTIKGYLLITLVKGCLDFVSWCGRTHLNCDCGNQLLLHRLSHQDRLYLWIVSQNKASSSKLLLSEYFIIATGKEACTLLLHDTWTFTCMVPLFSLHVSKKMHFKGKWLFHICRLLL